MNGANDYLMNPLTPSEDKDMCESAITKSKIEKDKLDDAVSLLAGMGFTDKEMIRTLLIMYNGDVSAVAHVLASTS